MTQAGSNQAPVANAGADSTTTLNQAVTLNGTYTDDGETPSVSQLWEKSTGPGTVTFSNQSSGNSTASFSAIGTYVLTYTVDDGQLSDTDQLTVTVEEASALETPATPEIAWRSPTEELVNGNVDIAITWTKYWGTSGNYWLLEQNNTEVFSSSIAEAGTGNQTASTTVSVNQAGEYTFVVKLCQKSGNELACAASNPTTITVTGSGGGTNPVVNCNAAGELPCMPYRADPVSLKVKGWPSHLAMGSITDNDQARNSDFAGAKLDAIFKYAGNGSGDRGQVVDPIVTRQTIAQARAIEDASGKQVNPTMVVYTANASGGGVAEQDITDNANLVKHLQNLIRIAATMQSNKDAQHASPGSLILNADLFGEWQKGFDAEFKQAYGEPGNWTAIAIAPALKQAIDNDATFAVIDNNGVNTNLNSLYNLVQIKSDVDAHISNDILGWVQAHNLIVKTFAPDVSFGWQINLWSPGSANWVHSQYAGLEATWLASSQSVAHFLDTIEAYKDNNYRPDFLTFDKYERDGFSPAGRGNYAFGARQWLNYLNYVRQITDHINSPAMIWQIPGGHMATNGENIGNYDLANHSSSAGTFFMGDSNIGEDTSSIRSEVLNIGLNSSVYDGANNVQALLQQESHNWGESQLRAAAYSNVFAILWGGGSTTAVVPIATNGAGDNDWLKDKIVRYMDTGKLPLYHVEQATNSSPLTSIVALNSELASLENKMNNEVFLYETPDSNWIPSTIYKWNDFLAALNPMHNVGIAETKFWLMDDNASETNNIKYAKVAIAAFLAQSMKETIQFNACDENNWSLNTGDPVNYPISASCGQLGQVYADYGMDAQGNDNPYSCPRNDKMEISALTHAAWYGAPAPLFVAPDAVLQAKGLLVNGFVGRWDYSTHCNTPSTGVDLSKQAYQREECKVYDGQKAGKFVWDGSAGKSVQGCGWWGRGVIQTTGRLNFGKLNHFLGRSHVDPSVANQTVNGTLVKKAPDNPLYADLDLCSNPELVCSTQEHKEIKWIAGLFFWMNEVQGYNDVGGTYANWNYHNELKAYVDGGLTGTQFIDDVSGIVNRGCPDTSCPVSGAVDGLDKRRENFTKVLVALGLNPQ